MYDVCVCMTTCTCLITFCSVCVIVHELFVYPFFCVVLVMLCYIILCG